MEIFHSSVNSDTSFYTTMSATGYSTIYITFYTTFCATSYTTVCTMQQSTQHSIQVYATICVSVYTTVCTMQQSAQQNILNISGQIRTFSESTVIAYHQLSKGTVKVKAQFVNKSTAFLATQPLICDVFCWSNRQNVIILIEMR